MEVNSLSHLRKHPISMENTLYLEELKKDDSPEGIKKFERMSKKILKDQKFAEAILDSSDKGGKFVIIDALNFLHRRFQRTQIK